jgi:hypothetical protein
MAAVRADDATVGRWRQRLVEVQAAQG